MAEKNYSKREIDQIFFAAKTEDDNFKVDIRAALSRIESQTVMTNGRVSRLERWQSYVVGFCACLSLILFSAVIPIITAFIQGR